MNYEFAGNCMTNRFKPLVQILQLIPEPYLANWIFQSVNVACKNEIKAIEYKPKKNSHDKRDMFNSIKRAQSQSKKDLEEVTIIGKYI